MDLPMHIKRYGVVPSTNIIALDLAQQNAAAWTVVVADGQTAGRGRLHRDWHSPPGQGLYCSVLLRPNLPLVEFPRLTLAAGVAVCRALSAAGVVAPRLKWPNDILLDGRKIGGILTETNPIDPMSPTSTAVIIGIGINVSTPLADFPSDLRMRATSIAAATGLSLDKESLLQSLLAQLHDVVLMLEQGDFAGVLDAWRGCDDLCGRILTWLTPVDDKVTGVAMGIDAAGQYRIRDAVGRVHEVLSGDLDLQI